MQAQEKRPNWAMANIGAAALGTKPGVVKKREPGKATISIGAHYLQVVTKDTLENQVGLSICIFQVRVWFASLCGILDAHHERIPLQLGAKFLVHTPGRVFKSKATRIAKATESAGSAVLGSLYIRANSQCCAGVVGVEADVERLLYRVASAISRNNHNLS